MANEAQVRLSLAVTNGTFRYQSQPTAFLANVAGTNGPTPGAVTATTAGLTVSLAQLTALGGLCFLQNRDTTNFVAYGVHNGGGFVPFGELLPGEFVVLRLSRLLTYGPTGTAHVNDLMLKADTASCNCVVEAFDP